MYPDKDSQSSRLFNRALNSIADGVSRSTIAMTPYPIYVKSGAGGRVIDVDGNELIDFNNNYTSLIHGHSRKEVTEAVQAQLSRGSAFSFATEAEIELAELLCGRVESFDQIRFCNSGTEAVMNLIKAARAYTGKPKIAKCEGAYHGSYDYAEVSLGIGPDIWGPQDQPTAIPYAVGTPERVLDDVIILPMNDVDRAERILKQNLDQLAGVLIDPVSSQIGMMGIDPEYLTMLERVVKSSGGLILFDEVIAFRMGKGGAQETSPIIPDITALGKIIGGGFPVGAVAGRSEVMNVFQKNGDKAKLPHGGTFNANPITMVAGTATMKLLTSETFASLNQQGEKLRKMLVEAFALANVEGQITGQGSLFRVHVHSRKIHNYRDAWLRSEEKNTMRLLHDELINRGIFIAPYGMGCISTATTNNDLTNFAESLLESLRVIRNIT